MKVLFQSQGLITDEYKNFYQSQVPQEIELVFPDDNSSETLLSLCDDIEVFVGYSVIPKFLEKAEELRHIQVPWTGFNSLDTELLQKYSHITVSNSHSNSLSIAEHAVSLMISAAKLIVYRDQNMRVGDWSSRYSDTNSLWLTGKTLGIIGYGAIGQKVAKMMKHGFDMKILAIKRNPTEVDELCDFVGNQSDLDFVIRESDYLLVAVPLTEETEGLISQEKFDLMKETAVIVNIARGPVIEEKALYEALKEKKIGAAGIDVWYNYPKSPNEPIIRQNYPFEELENIVMSPHSAFKVRDRVKAFAQDILENIRRIHEGKEPINQVNLEIGY